MIYDLMTASKSVYISQSKNLYTLNLQKFCMKDFIAIIYTVAIIPLLLL